MIVILASALLTPFAFGRGGNRGPGSGTSTCSLPSIVANLPYQEVDQTEQDEILYMLEEEKLARDVYKAMDDLWGLRVFRNIARAEQTHMDGIASLIEKYDLPDPVGDNGAGVFTNGDLQELYGQLVEQGSRSLNDALLVGATIEDLDIADLQKALAKTDNEDIQTVYQNLTKGSRNHLRAFISLLESNDVTYEPQYISAADFDQIVGSPKERGMLDAHGEINPDCAGPERRGGGRGHGRR